MSVLKYFSERPLRTQEGFPMRNAQIPNLRQDDYDNIELGLDARCRVFDLANEQDLKDYTEVLDHIANGDWTRLAPDLEMEDREKMTWRILCRWAEIKGDLPLNMMGAIV